MENKFPQTPQEFIKVMQEHMPKVSATQNGYEIRTKILGLALTQAHEEYQHRVGQFGINVKRENDEIVSDVSYPNADAVLEIAQKFNDFVSGKDKK